MKTAFTAIAAVLCAFVGIRRSNPSLADQGVRPIHIIVSALLCVIALVAMLVSIVRLVLR
jgi:Protein of unknown function (DUF2970)